MSSHTDDKPAVQNDDYVSRAGEKDEEVAVQSDSAPVGGVSGNQDTDEQLARDDSEAIDESNIVDGRTRGAKPIGSYREPGDDEGLPEADGRSAVAQ